MSSAAHGGSAPPPARADEPTSAEMVAFEERMSAALEVGEPDERYQRARAILAEVPLGAERDLLTARAASALGLRPSSLAPVAPAPAQTSSAPVAPAWSEASEVEQTVELVAPARAVEVVPGVSVQRDVDIDRYWRLGKMLALTEGDLSQEGAARGAMRYFLASELGVGALAARLIHVMSDGRVILGAELLRALAQREGLLIRRNDEPDACTATLVLAATGREIGASRYTLDQARRAGLLDNPRRPAWSRDPDAMLWARAASRVLRDYAPHVALRMEGLPAPIADRVELDVPSGYPEPTADDDIPF